MDLVHEKQRDASAPQGLAPAPESSPRGRPSKAALRGATYEEGVQMLAPMGAVVQRQDSDERYKDTHEALRGPEG